MRKLFFGYAVLSLVMFSWGTRSGCAVETARPNFVVVLVDDLRWDELSCTGSPIVRTPSIDAVANDGVRFRNAFATTPLCSPSRACLLTGQYAHQHGIFDNT